MATPVASHVRIVGILNVVLGAFMMAMGLFLFLMTGLVGAITGAAGAPGWVPTFVVGMAAMFALLFVLLALVPLLAGIGLLRLQDWGRLLGFVSAVVALFGFPLGTAFGAYSLWVLTRPEAAALLQGRAAAGTP